MLRLALIPIAQELRDALVRLWWLRRQRPKESVVGSLSGAGHVAHLVQQEICQKLDPNWRVWYRRSGGGIARHRACQQCGGVHEQRSADAPVAASHNDPGNA